MFHNWDWLINFCARRGQKNAQFRYVTFLMNLLSTQLWTGVKCSALSNFNKALQIPPSTPSTPPNRHHQTVMRSYKCIVLRQANNLPFLSVFFFYGNALNWHSATLWWGHIYNRAYRHRSVFFCDKPEWSAVRQWFIYWRSINWRYYITSTDLVSNPKA